VDCDEVGEQDCRISEQVGPHTGQVEEAIWGNVDIVQASVMDPAGRPRAGFGNGS
jgi:hypothetical protein